MRQSTYEIAAECLWVNNCMPKRIWMVQQKNLHCNYLPLRWRLGQYSDEQMDELFSKFKPDAPDHPKQYCPKLYTTRTHPLSGEYYVVEGSRFKAKPVENEIKFIVTERYQLHLRLEIIRSDAIFGDPGWRHVSLLDKNGLTFPELDLGIKGSSFLDLKETLIHLNPKLTEDTLFYVNKLEPIVVC